VGHEHGAHAVPACPRAEADERALVGHLEVVGGQLGEHGLHAARPGEGAVPAHARDSGAAQGDAASGGRVLVAVGGSGHDEHALEAGVHVRVSERVDGGAKPAGMGGVEVGDLQDAGPHGRASYAARPAAPDRWAVRAVTKCT
jgi:hypothetical protein